MAQTKPAIKSWTLWGVLLTLVPYIQKGVEQLPDVIPDILPVLPSGAAQIVQAVGIGIIAIRKLFGDNKGIYGLVK